MKVYIVMVGDEYEHNVYSVYETGNSQKRRLLGMGLTMLGLKSTSFRIRNA